MNSGLITMAQEYLCKGEHRKALEIYEKLSNIVSNPKELGDIHYHISLCHLCLENDELAKKYAKSALELHMRVGDFSALAKDMLQCALLEQNDRKARELLDESIVLATKARDFETLIEAINSMAFLERNENNMLEKVRKAYELAVEVGSTSGEIITLYTMGKILHELGKVNDARKAIKKAIELIGNDGGEEYYREIYELAQVVGVNYDKRGN